MKNSTFSIKKKNQVSILYVHTEHKVLQYGFTISILYKTFLVLNPSWILLFYYSIQD